MLHEETQPVEWRLGKLYRGLPSARCGIRVVEDHRRTCGLVSVVPGVVVGGDYAPLAGRVP